MNKRRLFAASALTILVLTASGVLLHFNTALHTDRKKADVVDGPITLNPGGLTVVDTLQMNTQPPEGKPSESSTTSQTQQADSQAAASQGNTFTPNTYQAPAANNDCYKTVITYNTIYKDDPYRYIGEEWSPGPGQNGYVLHCSYGDFTVPAVDQIVRQGTKQRTSTDTGSTTGISYEAALSSCLALGTSGTSAFEQCMNAYGY